MVPIVRVFYVCIVEFCMVLYKTCICQKIDSCISRVWSSMVEYPLCLSCRRRNHHRLCCFHMSLTKTVSSEMFVYHACHFWTKGS